MKTLTQLTDDAQVAGWVPTEAWADLILEASVCYGQISGVISAVDYDLAAGNGDSVRVRTFPAVALPTGNSNGCQCLSVTSSYLQFVNIAIQQYGIYDAMCAWSLWNAKGPVKEGILNEFSKSLAATRDTAIITALGVGLNHYHATTAVSYTSQVTSAVGCCDYAFNLYNSIVSVAGHMKSHCVNPDTVIVNPLVAAWFYKGDRGGEHGLHIQFDANDKLIKIAGMNIIETGLMPLGTTGRITLAYVLDSSRAIGEVWGMRPTFTEVYNNICNRYDETVWMYWGCSKLSIMSVGTVLSTGAW